MSILYILLAIVLLGILIMVHELGHFVASRLCGVAVKEFSIGFGPKLVQWKSKKHGTLFTIRPIPMGGYCMFYGETASDDDAEAIAADDPRNYSLAPVWKRMIGVLAGPLMNLVLAFVIALVMAMSYGSVITTPHLVEVPEGQPAYEAGLRVDDVLLTVNGVDVSSGTAQDVVTAIGAAATSDIAFTVRRGDEQLDLIVTPEWSEAEQRALIGVTISHAGSMPTSDYLPAAWEMCVSASTAVLDGFRTMFTTADGLKQGSGPVGVVQQVAVLTQQGGLPIFLNLLVLISINLGLLNLFPIPGLDGCRFVFMVLEAIRRKPVSPRIESIVHLCGYGLLLLLMVVLTFQDVGRIIG